eukprot:gb/GECG01011870.1/.p1 GENE.gb/GECG01011870.1/~~gb/GECG01011870.1/.p1  ORF type:complete len:112 (+),score=7.13 gb/GECG01011870.1/:1-336(+)
MPSKNNATHFRIEILEYPVRRLHPWGMSFVPRRSHPLPISFALKAGGSIHPLYPTTTRNAASSTTDLLILSDELRPLIQNNSTQTFSHFSASVGDKLHTPPEDTRESRAVI